jgi:hypothetical protein
MVLNALDFLSWLQTTGNKNRKNIIIEILFFTFFYG